MTKPDGTASPKSEDEAELEIGNRSRRKKRLLLFFLRIYFLGEYNGVAEVSNDLLEALSENIVNLLLKQTQAGVAGSYSASALL